MATSAPVRLRTEAAAVALPRSRPRPRSHVRALPRRRAFGGASWIVLFGALLAGVVAVNVAVLQLNVRLDKLRAERVQLRADTARLRAELSSAGAAAEVEARAKTSLGLVRADATTTSYIELPPRR
jgi:cell division protein FtsL